MKLFISERHKPSWQGGWKYIVVDWVVYNLECMLLLSISLSWTIKKENFGVCNCENSSGSDGGGGSSSGRANSDGGGGDDGGETSKECRVVKNHAFMEEEWKFQESFEILKKREEKKWVQK